jgi:hypothetical protein
MSWSSYLEWPGDYLHVDTSESLEDALETAQIVFEAVKEWLPLATSRTVRRTEDGPPLVGERMRNPHANMILEPVKTADGRLVRAPKWVVQKLIKDSQHIGQARRLAELRRRESNG